MSATGTKAPPKAQTGNGRPPVDPRFRARRVEVRRSQGRRRLRRLAVVAVVLGGLVVAAGLTLTPALDVDRVRVSGQYRTPIEEIVAAGGIAEGDPMAFADLGAARRRVEALPWVATAEVTRSWPGTVEYTIEEREPAAALEGPAGQWWATDGVGRVVAALDERPADLPAVHGVSVATEVGATAAPGDRAPFQVAAALPRPLRRLVASVGWDGTAVAVALRDGGLVELGDLEDLGDKGVAAASVLAAEDPACVARLDVSIPDAPVLTRVPGCG